MGLKRFFCRILAVNLLLIIEALLQGKVVTCELMLNW